MALTISVVDRTVMGNKKIVIADLTFDSSYAYGGESLTAADLGIFGIDQVLGFDGPLGYIPKYDYTNSKIQLFGPAPPIMVEAKHTAVANSVTLDYPAAWIINVTQTGQNMQWAATGTAAGSLGANQFCLTSAIVAGERTGLTTDGATDTVLVTYVTQAWKDVFDNLVQEESLALATGAVDSANKMLCFGYCSGSTAGALIPVDTADTTASGEVGIKFNVTTGTLDIHADENGETGKFTYIKRPASGFLNDRAIADEDATLSGADPYLQSLDLPCLLWGISGYATVDGQTSKAIIEMDVTVATNECNMAWLMNNLTGTGAAMTNGLIIGFKDNQTLTQAAYVWGTGVWEIPGLEPLEIRNASSIADVVMRATILGY